METLRRRLSHIALVLATRIEPDQLDCAGRIGFDALVPMDRLESDVADGMRRALAVTPRGRLHQALSSAPGLSEDLLAILRTLLDHPDHPRTLKRAAWLSARSAATVERHWHAAYPRPGGPRLKDITDSILLFRACELAASELCWEEIAWELATTVKTLRRTAKRAWGRQLGDLRRLGPGGALFLVLAQLADEQAAAGCSDAAGVEAATGQLRGNDPSVRPNDSPAIRACAAS